MSENETIQETNHAMLVVWGQYAHCLGIPQEFAQVPMSQKTVEHSPQSKVLEFLVAQLAGLEYLKDISLSANPLDQLEIYQQLGDQAYQVEAASLLGTHLQNKGTDLAQAIHYEQMALEISRAIGYRLMEARILNNLANVYATSDLNRALDNYD